MLVSTALQKDILYFLLNYNYLEAIFSGCNEDLSHFSFEIFDLFMKDDALLEMYLLYIVLYI